MIKLVASDIDGTLLQGGRRELNPELFDIILELKKRGIQFVAASGRQVENMQKLFEPLTDEIFYISDNGAICKYKDELKVLFVYEQEMQKCILQELEKFPDCKVAVSSPTTQYIKSGDEEFYGFMTESVKYHITEIDSFFNIEEPIIKIAYYNDSNQEERYEYFNKRFGQMLRVAKAGINWVDFISFDSNKGTGVKFLMEIFGISSDEIIVFGDQENDIEMLELTKNSYAMTNAKDWVKKHATHTTSSVEKILLELLEDK